MAVPISTPLEVMTLANAAKVEELAQLGRDYAEPVRVVAFSPDGELVACSTYKQIFVWDAHWREERLRLDLPTQSLTFTADSKTLVAAGTDIVFLSIPEGEQQAKLKGHRGGTTCIAFSADGEMLASGGMDGVVRVGHLASKKLVCQLQHPAPVRALGFSPDDELIATISWENDDQPRSVSLWRVAGGEQMQTLPCKKEKNLSFSPDGALLAVEGKIFEIETGRTLYNFGERQVAFSPDGSLAASCHHNFPTIGLWEMSSGQKLVSLSGHEDPVWQVAFSPDGLRLASCSGSLNMSAALRGEEDVLQGDYTLRLWGVPGESSESGSKPRRPLKRLGEENAEGEEGDDNPLKDLLNRFSR